MPHESRQTEERAPAQVRLKAPVWVSEPDLPHGWSYNPSSRPQRAPAIALALASVLVSAIAWQWSWPAVALPLLVAVTGGLGGRTRWHGRPWLVAVFGLSLLASLAFVVAPAVIRLLATSDWCGPCLVSAFLLLLAVPFSLDEVLATFQFMLEDRDSGRPFAPTFLHGALPEQDLHPAEIARPEAPFRRAMAWGVGAPWSLVVSGLLGAWLMVAPPVLGSLDGDADSNILAGALVVALSVIALAELARPLRYLTPLLGASVMITAWLFSGGTPLSDWNSALVGLFLIGLGLPLGPIYECYGPWDKYIS